MVSGYSGRAVKPIAQRFIAEIGANPIIRNVQISGIGGITLWKDALEFIQLGCRNLQVCTAVMEFGQRIVEDLKWGLQNYMRGRGITSLDQLVGEELPKISRAQDVDRGTIVYPVVDRSKCIGCGRCYISCSDGGHQALSFGADRQPRLNGAKCVGCHLCSLVCPTGAIGFSKRVPKKA
jgi:dihydropyrimidine dehydrogenase (NAD+) subunit PreA